MGSLEKHLGYSRASGMGIGEVTDGFRVHVYLGAIKTFQDPELDTGWDSARVVEPLGVFGCAREQEPHVFSQRVPVLAQDLQQHSMEAGGDS